MKTTTHYFIVGLCLGFIVGVLFMQTLQLIVKGI